MSLHSGHRQRMRERFLNCGLSDFEKHEVLELLLYYCIPRVNTNELAHRLIGRFKTIARVLQATPDELMSVEGIGESTATYLALLNETIRYVGVERSMEMEVLNTAEAYVAYLKNLFLGMSTEAVYMLCLDAKQAVIGHYLLSEGTVTSANIPTRTLLSKALSTNAVYVILAHNHPGGLPLPSKEDEEVTVHIASLLRAADVTLLDHVIVSDSNHISMNSRSVFMDREY